MDLKQSWNPAKYKKPNRNIKHPILTDWVNLPLHYFNVSNLRTKVQIDFRGQNDIRENETGDWAGHRDGSSYRGQTEVNSESNRGRILINRVMLMTNRVKQRSNWGQTGVKLNTLPCTLKTSFTGPIVSPAVNVTIDCFAHFHVLIFPAVALLAIIPCFCLFVCI